MWWRFGFRGGGGSGGGGGVDLEEMVVAAVDLVVDLEVWSWRRRRWRWRWYGFGCRFGGGGVGLIAAVVWWTNLCYDIAGNWKVENLKDYSIKIPFELLNNLSVFSNLW
ncbi:hypothetical protein Q3G72_029271 [Acer saccharum]|nr:hypothetical protein Q3G72_029271 [Acer saccharum]